MENYSSSDTESNAEKKFVPRRRKKHSDHVSTSNSETRRKSRNVNKNSAKETEEVHHPEDFSKNLSSTMLELFRTPIFENESHHSNIEESEELEHGDDNTKGKKYKADEETEEKVDSQMPQVMDLLHGKDEISWTTKLFFRSAEMIFPGFTKYADAQNRIKRFSKSV